MDVHNTTRKRRLGTLLLLLLEYYRHLCNFLNTMILLEEELNVQTTACSLVAAELEASLLDIERIPPLRIINYVERTIPGLTSIQFQEHFRMTPDIFDIVLREFAPLITSTNKYSPITKLMDPKKQLLAVLWLLATPDSYRSVAERFDMGKSSLHKSFNIVIKVLCNKSNCLIKWPLGQEESIAEKFKKFAGIPNVLGAVDGSYVPIKAPKNYPERYINRKCHHAITLQAVCDADLVFTDVFVGYPSSVSDYRIFKNSDLYKNILNKRLIIPDNYFIVGDKAYPLLSWCITPYFDRGQLSNQEKKFNVAISKTRQCIERSFALLKGRFRRLKYLNMSNTEFIPSVILAACVLHNICLMNGSDSAAIEEFITTGMPSIMGDIEYHVEASQRDGNTIRNRLMVNI